MQGKCDKEIPALLAVDDRQRVSCFLYHDQPAEAAPVTASVEAAL
jgi:hypothetical protein